MYIVLKIKDNLPQDVYCVTEDYDTVTRRFVEVCREQVSNFDEFTADDIDSCLDDGFCEMVNGSMICLMDVSNWNENGAIS